MTIDLPPSRLEHLAGSPLKLAIAQVRFRPDPAVETPERQVALSRALAELYELAGRDVVQTVTVQIGQGGQVGQPSPLPQAEPVLRFESRDGRSRLAITPSSVGLETASYDTFEGFRERLGQALEAVAAVIDLRTQIRLGLRYVNEIHDIRLEREGGLAEIVAQSFLPAGGVLGLAIRGGFSEILFDQPDGTFVLRRGLIEPSKYLLDMDYFNEDEQPFDPEAVVEAVTRYHAVIESVFCAALRPEFVDELRARGEGAE